MTGGMVPWFIVAALAAHLAEQGIKSGGGYRVALWGMLSGFSLATVLFIGVIKGLGSP